MNESDELAKRVCALSGTNVPDIRIFKFFLSAKPDLSG